MFAGIIFCLTFFQSESPRYLIKQGKHERALATMARLRHLPETHPYVTKEIAAIKLSHQEEIEATKSAGLIGKLKEMFLVRSNLYRLFLATGAQVMSQCWSPSGRQSLQSIC